MHECLYAFIGYLNAHNATYYFQAVKQAVLREVGLGPWAMIVIT